MGSKVVIAIIVLSIIMWLLVIVSVVKLAQVG